MQGNHKKDTTQTQNKQVRNLHLYDKNVHCFHILFLLYLIIIGQNLKTDELLLWFGSYEHELSGLFLKEFVDLMFRFSCCFLPSCHEYKQGRLYRVGLAHISSDNGISKRTTCDRSVKQQIRLRRSLIF